MPITIFAVIITIKNNCVAPAPTAISAAATINVKMLKNVNMFCINMER